MRFLRSILLALLISLTTWIGGCDDDDDQSGEEPPVAGETAGETAGDMAGDMAGEMAGDESALDQGITSAGESASDQDVSGGTQNEDCAPEFETDEGCDEPIPTTDPACEQDSLEEGEDCDDNVEPTEDDASDS